MQIYKNLHMSGACRVNATCGSIDPTFCKGDRRTDALEILLMMEAELKSKSQSPIGAPINSKLGIEKDGIVMGN